MLQYLLHENKTANEKKIQEDASTCALKNSLSL